MLIKIIQVSQPEKIKTYFTMEVNYKDEQGRTQGKKLMSFTFPTVFEALKNAQQGETYDIETKKNDKGYWDWVSARKSDGTISEPSGARPASTVKSSSTYETADERAKRQKLIVRQSSLTAAISILSSNNTALEVEDVLGLANRLTDWVFEEEVKVQPEPSDFSDMEDDIPN